MRHAARALAGKPYTPQRSKRVNPRWIGQDPTQLGNIMRAHPNYAALGAIGPDLCFFLPDFRDQNGIVLSSVLVKVLSFLEGLYAAIDPYISKWEHYLGPISEDTAEEMSRLTGGLSETVGDISGELSAILVTALEDFFVTQRDWWSFFSLGLNHGWEEQSYFWSDMLHYRGTDQFGRMLWKNADATGDDAARAYALGYISHLATDVTGHAFVNAISGGPFRLHWQRHHLVENHADCFWYLTDPEPEGPRTIDGYDQLTESALYFDIAFVDRTGAAQSRPSFPPGHTLRDNWIRKRRLDLDSELGEPIGDLLIKTMQDVFYNGAPHPKILRGTDGLPTAELLGEAYRLFFRYLKLATVDGFSHEPPDPPDVFPNLDFPTLTDPNDAPPGEGDGGSFWDDLLNFILSVISIILFIVEVAIYLATLPWAILADIVTYPLRLGLYYALELPLYHILKNFRAVLVLTGYMLPMKDEIVRSLIEVGSTGQESFQQALAEMGDTFGGFAVPPIEPADEQRFADRRYPYSHPEFEFRHPWQYPDKDEDGITDIPTELPLTTAGPHAVQTGPTVLFRDLDADIDIRDRLEGATTPAQADAIDHDIAPRHSLGDPVSFSKYLIWLSTRDDPQEDGSHIPGADWNLDSDRGYGYHCWDFNRRPDATEADPEGNDFLQPCTWPQQATAEGHAWHPDLPLKIHWADEPDPHCDEPDEPIPPPITRPRPRPRRRPR